MDCCRGLSAHAEVARLVVGHEQRRPLRLRLLPRLLARQRRRRCSPLRRRPPLRRPRDAQRRLLGGGKAAQVHHLAAALHRRLVGPGPASLRMVAHAVVARLVVGHAQRQPLRLRLLLHLLARRRRRRCSPLRRRPPLRRPCDAQRRLLGGGKASQVHHRSTAPHLRSEGLGRAGVDEINAVVARLVIGLQQRHPLRLRLSLPHGRPRQHGATGEVADARRSGERRKKKKKTW